jgi:hypothetical protein
VARLWPAPAPVPGTPERVTLAVAVATGLELDADGQVHVLDAAAWQERKQRLEAQGEAPP